MWHTLAEADVRKALDIFMSMSVEEPCGFGVGDLLLERGETFTCYLLGEVYSHARGHLGDVRPTTICG